MERVSDHIDDGWQRRGTWDQYCGGYLAKRMEVPISEPSSTPPSDAIDVDDAEQDDSCLAVGAFSDFYIKELHIVYNMAHAVPTLFLRAHQPGR